MSHQLNVGISLAFQDLNPRTSEIPLFRSRGTEFFLRERSWAASKADDEPVSSRGRIVGTESCSSFTHFSVKGHNHVGYTPRPVA